MNTQLMRSVDAINFHVITGCSGGGKSTLLSELEKRGYRVFPKPGRQIVKEQQPVSGDGLPWKNVTKFAELCVSRAMYCYNSAILPATLVQYRYANRVFMVPPWREIFVQDAERQHSYAEAQQEFYGLQQGYEPNNYVQLPEKCKDNRCRQQGRTLWRGGFTSPKGSTRTVRPRRTRQPAANC